MVGLDHFPDGLEQSAAQAVSADGSVVVGGSWDNVTGEAFRWTEADGMVGLGYLPGTSRSSATGVSADGSIIVGGSGIPGTGVGQAFIWTIEGGMEPLDASVFWSGASAVSADGSVVVGMSRATSSDGALGFRWTAADGIQPLQDLLEAQGVDLTGWSLSQTNGVSADGTAIVGRSRNPDFNSEAWLAVP